MFAFLISLSQCGHALPLFFLLAHVPFVAFAPHVDPSAPITEVAAAAALHVVASSCLLGHLSTARALLHLGTLCEGHEGLVLRVVRMSHLVLFARLTFVERRAAGETISLLALGTTEVGDALLEEEGVLASERRTPGDVCLLIDCLI